MNTTILITWNLLSMLSSATTMLISTSVIIGKSISLWCSDWGYVIWASSSCSYICKGRVGLWGFLWWAPSAKRKDHHGVSSGWSSTWCHLNTGLSSAQYEQIPNIFGVWPFWLTPFFSGSNILAGLWLNCISSVEITLFFWLTYYCSIGPCFSVMVQLSDGRFSM